MKECIYYLLTQKKAAHKTHVPSRVPLCKLPGWWFEFSFRATGRFVYTLTDQTLNTNIYGPWLFIITVVVVIVVVYSVLLFMWFTFILPCTKTKQKISEQLASQQYKITAILDRRLLQQPSRQTLGTEKYLTRGNC